MYPMLRGSKRPKGNGWELRYKGHSRTVKASGARAAGNMLKDFCDEIDAAGVGTYKASNMTVPEMVLRWLDNRMPDLGQRTADNYAAIERRHIRPYFEDTLVRSVTAPDINDFYTHLRKKGLAAATRVKVHHILNGAYEHARDEGLFWGEPPTRRAKRPELEKRQIDGPTMEEVERLLAGAEEYSEEMGAIVFTAIHTGMRAGEICALRWSRVNLEEGSLVVARSLTQHLLEKSPKNGETRQLEFGVVLIERLRLHMDYVTERAAKVGMELDPNGYVFSTNITGSTPYNPHSVSTAFRRIKQRAGLSPRFHDMRHFHASVMLSEGVDLTTVARRLGHKRGSTTLDFYAHMMPGKDRAAHDTFAAAMAGKAAQ